MGRRGSGSSTERRHSIRRRSVTATHSAAPPIAMSSLLERTLPRQDVAPFSPGRVRLRKSAYSPSSTPVSAGKVMVHMKDFPGGGHAQDIIRFVFLDEDAKYLENFSKKFSRWGFLFQNFRDGAALLAALEVGP